MTPIEHLSDDAADAALAATGWYARVGGRPHFPMSADQAADLLHRGGEYDVDPGRLSRLAARGIVTAPGDGLWNPADVVQAGAVLEARRQWVPTPSLHDMKKTAAVLALEQARTSDSVAEFVAARPRLDARHLLVLLTEADNRELREKLAVGLTATLEADHGVRL